MAKANKPAEKPAKKASEILWDWKPYSHKRL